MIVLQEYCVVSFNSPFFTELKNSMKVLLLKILFLELHKD